MTQTAAELIRSAKPRTAEFPVCLDPDLVDEHAALVRDKADDVEVEQALARVRAATITLRFKALPRAEFRALADAHPPRVDAEGKQTHASRDWIGVNYAAFFDAAVPASLVEPELDQETLQLLLDQLTDRQYETLTDVVWNLNRQRVDVPFSSAA